MPINKQGVRDNIDGTCTVQMSDRHEQLESIANEFAKVFKDVLGESRQRQLLGYCETLRIIAQELKTIPDPALIAERIYGTLKDVSAAGGFGQKETFVPGYVHNLIFDILSDKYAHLNCVQREKIREATAKIQSDGTKESYAIARKLISDWSIEHMLQFWLDVGDDPSVLIDFDPTTGEPWENK
jgi:hypothetical protein